MLNGLLEQRVSWLKEWLRELEALLARYEPVAVHAPGHPPGHPPPGMAETVSVFRNGVFAGEVVIAGGRWTDTAGVPDLVQSDIVLAIWRDIILFGSLTLDGEAFSWRENDHSCPS